MATLFRLLRYALSASSFFAGVVESMILFLSFTETDIVII